MAIIHHEYVEQGSDEWMKLRCGVLTAGEFKHILTPTLKLANNDKTRQHVWEIAAQRINDYTEPTYMSHDMVRGHVDEVDARIIYEEKYEKVDDCGFITNDKFGFILGYSPDGLVGENGLIECKSRRQKYQMQTIALDEVPEEFVLQLQAGLLISERHWIDFVSYCGGMHMYVKRVYPDTEIQDAIIDAAKSFETRVNEVIELYKANSRHFHMTERKFYDDIVI